MKRAMTAFGRRVRARVVDRSVNRIMAARRSFNRRRQGVIPIPRALVGRVQTSGFFGRFRPGGPEAKFLDTTEAQTAVAIAGTIGQQSLNVIPQDDTQSGRIGRKVTVKSLFIKGQIILPATTVAANTTDLMRIIVYIDKQTNGASAAVATLLETAAINSFRNMANVSRFQILFDKTFTLRCDAGGAPTATPSFNTVVRHFQINVTKLNVVIEYDATATTGAIATQRTNNIGQMALTLSNLATLGYTARIRYDDV